MLGQVSHMPGLLTCCSLPPPGTCRLSPGAQQVQVATGGAAHRPGARPADPISLPANRRLSPEAQQAGPGPAGPGGGGRRCSEAKVKRLIWPLGRAHGLGVFPREN